MEKEDRKILLVEDNPDDVDLTLRALKKYNVRNEVVVVRDGAEALDYLFATGKYTDRDASDLPAAVLLDLKLPKVDIKLLAGNQLDPKVVEAFLGVGDQVRSTVYPHVEP